MRKSFSLTEILVVMFIILLVGGVSIFVFQKLSQKQEIKKSAEEVKNLILEARSLAMTPPSNFNSLKYVRVVIERERAGTQNERVSIIPVTSPDTFDWPQTPIRSLEFDVEEVSFDNLTNTNLEDPFNTPATPSDYQACDNTPPNYDTICQIDFMVDIKNAGEAKKTYLTSPNPKFCFINNAHAGNVSEQVGQCITVNYLTGLVTISDN